MRWVRAGISAFRFLTALPLGEEREWDETLFGRSALFYPLVGAVIGALVAVVLLGLRAIFPPAFAACLSLCVWVGLTGGLHFDGVCDCLDAFCFQGSVEKRLSIMKDVHHGSFALVGVVLMLLVKASCLFFVPARIALFIFPLAGALGRWSILLLAQMPVANPTGMAAALKRNLTRAAPVIGLVVPLGIAMALGGYLPALVLFCAAFLSIGAVGWLSLRKIGGITGDVLGLAVEMTEIAVLIAAVALIHQGWYHGLVGMI